MEFWEVSLVISVVVVSLGRNSISVRFVRGGGGIRFRGGELELFGF